MMMMILFPRRQERKSWLHNTRMKTLLQHNSQMKTLLQKHQGRESWLHNTRMKTLLQKDQGQKSWLHKTRMKTLLQKESVAITAKLNARCLAASFMAKT